MYLADYHLHTNISDDSPALLTQQAENALKAGLQEICVTDHWNLFDQLAQPLSHTRDWEPSIQRVKEARKQFKGKLNIRLGIEVGNGESDPEAINLGLQKAGKYLDFAIGSLHNMSAGSGALGIFTAAKRAETIDQGRAILDDYVDTLSALADTKGYDVLGHIIYPLRYLPPEWELTLDPYEEQLRDIFRRVIDSGRGIEVNTTQGATVESWLPVLKLYKDCGGEIITMGSDAHQCHQVGAAFREMRQVLLDCGYRWQAIYRRRQPWMHRL